MKFVSEVEQEGISLITMDDGKANAMGFQMLAELDAALERSINYADVTILRGRKGLLSAGFDLKIIQEGTSEEKSELVSKGISVLMKLFGLANPLIVSVPGHAVALGGFLTLVGDYRIGLQGDYKIGLNETAIGLPLPMFGLELVKHRLNPAYVTRSAITAELFSPEEAVKVGFLDVVVSEGALTKEAFSVARRMMSLDKPAMQKTKSDLRRELIARVLDYHDIRRGGNSNG